MAVALVSDKDFKDQLSLSEKTVVKYFADWCGSCKLFAPKFKRLSNEDRFADISFLEVNAEENPEARKMAGVSNLPYFAVFKNEEFVDAIASAKEEAVVGLIEKLK